MFAVKAGSLTVLTAGEQAAGHIEQPPLHLSRADARQMPFRSSASPTGLRRLFRRYLVLGAMLAVAYAVAVPPTDSWCSARPSSRPSTARSSSRWRRSGLIGLITLINFLYLLTQIVVAADDCGVVDAMSRVARLLVRDGRTIIGVLGAILALMVLTTAASVLATAALGLIAFVPFVGLAALPLQVIAWLVRGRGLPVHQPGRSRGVPASPPTGAAWPRCGRWRPIRSAASRRS